MADPSESGGGGLQSTDARAKRYALARGITVRARRGEQSQDGDIYLTDRRSVVKVFNRPVTFKKEDEAYQRLSALGPDETITGHHVPRLIDRDPELGVLELTLATPPFVLDFGKIQLDLMLKEVWEPEILEELWAYWKSLFEPHEWPQVLRIAGILGDRFGIYLEDFHRGNIAFAKRDDLDEDR